MGTTVDTKRMLRRSRGMAAFLFVFAVGTAALLALGLAPSGQVARAAQATMTAPAAVQPLAVRRGRGVVEVLAAQAADGTMVVLTSDADQAAQPCM